MFCASVMPVIGSIREIQHQFPDYNCATFISDPSTFAMQLGKDFGKQCDMQQVRLSSVDRMVNLLGLQGIDTVVKVTHGPVIYCASAEEREIVNRVPVERQTMVISFAKRREYAGQRECRFVVEVIGEPIETKFVLEITNELRRMTYPILGLTWLQHCP